MVEKRLGQGGMGDVLLARDTELDRLVALKVFNIPAAQLAIATAARQRFEREAKVAAAHPHEALVPLLGAALDHEPPFLVFPVLTGGDLEAEIGRGPATPSRVAEVGERLASALAHLHGHGILHRDIKPANVLLDGNGLPFLADLGLVGLGEGHHLTATGMVVGTPRYMPPETLLRGEVLAAGDTYALGLTLLELATGKPFRGKQDTWTQAAQRAAGLPRGPLRSLLLRMVRETASGRPEDLGEVAEIFRAQRSFTEALPEPGSEPTWDGEDATATLSNVVPVAPSATAAHPPDPSSGTTLPPARNPRRALAGVALGLLALGLYLRPRDPGPPPAPPPPAAAPDPDAALVEELATLREAVGDLQGRRVAVDYRLVPVDGAGEGPPLLDGDPWCWPAVRANLPGFATLVAAVRTRAREAPASPELGAALARTDRFFTDLGLPAPFAPWTLPPHPRGPAPRTVRELPDMVQVLFRAPGLDRLRKDGSLGSLGPALGVLVEIHTEMERRAAAIEQGLPELPPEIQALSPGFGGFRTGLEALVRRSTRDAAVRTTLWRWLAPLAGALRASLAAIGRAFEEGAPEAPIAALVTLRLLDRRTTHLFLGDPGFEDAASLLGRAPAAPAEADLALGLVACQVKTLEQGGVLPPHSDALLRLRGILGSLPPPTREPGVELTVRLLSLEFALEALVNEGEPGDRRALLAEVIRLPVLPAAGVDLAIRAAERVMRTARGLTREERNRVADLLGPHRGSLGPHLEKRLGHRDEGAFLTAVARGLLEPTAADVIEDLRIPSR